MSLSIVEGWDWDEDAVTQTFALLAMRGSGKSSAAVRMGEQMHAAGLPWVAIDPKGDWHGIRTSADGKSAGLPIPVFGGLHGDLPLEASAGALIADLIVDSNLTCILDVSEFSKGDQTRFLVDLGERLFKRHGREPHPRHLFLEEADDFIPQRVTANVARCVGAWTKIIKQGRSRGLGITLISQRSAVVAKDALTQTDTLLAMRCTSPQDRKAILGWVDYHSVSREVVDSLPTLLNGDVWVISPQWLKTIERAHFLPRTTFDSGATPTMGKSRQVATLADIDLAAIKEQMADTIERAKESDPKELHRQIAALRKELAVRPSAEPVTVEVDVEREVEVEVSVLTDEDRSLLRDVVSCISTLGDLMIEVSAPLRKISESAAAQSAPPPARMTKGDNQRAPAPRPRVAPAAASRPPKVEGLGSGENKVLQVLSEYPAGRTQSQLAFLAGYSAKASTVGVILAKLRRMGLVEQGQPIRLTAEGKALAPPPEQLSGQDLLAKWMQHPRMGAGERQVLQVLIGAYPIIITHDELCDRAGYSTTASTVGVILSKLRKLGLVSTSGRVLDEDFAGSIGL